MPPKSLLNPKFKLSKDLRLGILLGGNSSEREISLRSGRAVEKAFKKLGFDPVCVDPANQEDLKSIDRLDVAFIALHGHGGEDGEIQRLLEKKKVPYIGSDAKASWRAFDKEVSKRLFRRFGIPSPDFFVMKSLQDWKKLEKFPRPFVVKPPCNGSSVGIFFVEDLNESAEKIRHAFIEHGRLLIEKKIQGRELTVGVLGEKALPVIELVPKRDFYDYTAKYTAGMTDYLVPAPISKSLARRLQKISLEVHRRLGLRDFSRTDIMLDAKNQPFVLEANSIPGFTELSLLPKAAGAAGISFEEVCLKLVTWGYARGAMKNGKKKT